MLAYLPLQVIPVVHEPPGARPKEASTTTDDEHLGAFIATCQSSLCALTLIILKWSVVCLHVCVCVVLNFIS